MKKFLRLLRSAAIPLVALVVIAGIIGFRLWFTPMVIETGSMEPVMPIGTVAFVHPSESLKPGDIISFQQSSMSRPTTHTFIGYADDGSIETKGDANPTPDVRDVPLQKADVIGKVMFTLPYFSSFFWTSVRGVLSLGIIALMMISIIIVLVSDRKKKGLPLDQTSELAHA